MRSDKFGSQLDWESKTWFFTFFNVYVSWIERDKILISQLSPQNSGILQTRMYQWSRPHKNEFWHFSNAKWISQTVKAQKVDEKNGVICLVSYFPSWVMVLKLPKIVQICVLTSARNLNLLKAIYLYPSGRHHHALSKNSMFYRGLSNSSRDIEE